MGSKIYLTIVIIIYIIALILDINFGFESHFQSVPIFLTVIYIAFKLAKNCYH